MDHSETDTGRLLIVHGDAAKLDYLSCRLREAGYAVRAAAGATEGLTLATAETPDVVILDVHTPEADGERFLTGLQATRGLRETPVIVLASDGENDKVERCLAAGADDFLFAPYSPTLLKAQVRDFLHIGKHRREERERHERETLLKIERDVQIARQIQLGFLPSELPQPAGWEIAARFYPAREVAGDFYDAFMLTQGRRVGLVIADVCDKGVGAALFMALFRSLIRAYSLQHYSMRWMDVLDDDFSPRPGGRQRSAPSTGTTALKNAMELTNDYMAHNHAETNMFATVFFGVLDPTTGLLTYVNGGHNPPVVLGTAVGSSDGAMPVKARLKPTGPAVGMFPDIEYKLGQVELEPGDILFTFTDGVTDARDPQGTLFGEKRMLPLVQQPSESATALLDRVDAAVHAHIAEAPQFDDVTMLAVQYKPEIES